MDPRAYDLVFPTGGGCMRPWIWPGGKLYVRRCAVQDLRVGDIAVWFDGKRLLSHRVVSISPDGRFTTRGDLYKRSDPPADGNQLVGVAVRFQWRWISYELGATQRLEWLRRAAALLRRMRRG